MKRHGNLWDKITCPDNLLRAYREARRGKGWQRHVKWFERNVNGNLLRLQKMLCTGAFSTSEYRKKTIYEPKQRDIYVLPFYPDRIVQHALLQVVAPLWDALFIEQSYACRKGRGMHQASQQTMHHVRKYKYFLKADISKFYPSINHDILLSIIERKIKCKRTLSLLENIVRSFDGDKNVPIGNYTSQWFGNLYMNELDQKIRHEHKISAYVRYCDDFIVFHDCKKALSAIKDWIEDFLSSRLALKFSRWSIAPVSHGVDFVGYRHFVGKVLLRKSTARRAQRRMAALLPKLNACKITIDQFRSSIASTEGWLKWANTYNLRLSMKLEELKGEIA